MHGSPPPPSDLHSAAAVAPTKKPSERSLAARSEPVPHVRKPSNLYQSVRDIIPILYCRKYCDGNYIVGHSGARFGIFLWAAATIDWPPPHITTTSAMAARPDFDLLLNAFTSADNGVRRQAEAAWEDVKRQRPDEVRTPCCCTGCPVIFLLL